MPKPVSDPLAGHRPKAKMLPQEAWRLTSSGYSNVAANTARLGSTATGHIIALDPA